MLRSRAKYLFLLIPLIALFLFFLPSFLSTSWGIDQIKKGLNKHEWIEIEEAKFSWFNKQVLSNITYKSSSLKIQIPHMELHTGLFSLFFSPTPFINAILYNPNTTFQMGSGKKPASFHFTPHLPFIGYLFIRGGTVSIERPEKTSLLKKLNIEMIADQSTDMVNWLVGGETIDETLRGFFLIEGKMPKEAFLTTNFSNISEKNCFFSISMNHFPTVLLDLLSSQGGDPSFQRWLGRRVNLTAEGCLLQKNGYLSLSFNSPNVDFSTEGSIENGLLRPTKPFKILLREKAPIKEWIFNKILLEVFQFSSPFRIRISKKEASFPLFDGFESFISKSSIEEGFLHIGKVRATKSPIVTNILNFLQLHTPTQETIPLWFQSAKFTIQNGLLQFYRTDFLFDEKYQLAFWGKINLATSEANLFIGVTKQCLEKLFHLKTIPDDSLIIIPVHGPLHNLHFDVTNGAKQLALLAMMTKTPLRKIFPEEFFILQSFDSPQPRGPLPWEDDNEKSEVSDS